MLFRGLLQAPFVSFAAAFVAPVGRSTTSTRSSLSVPSTPCSIRTLSPAASSSLLSHNCRSSIADLLTLRAKMTAVDTAAASTGSSAEVSSFSADAKLASSTTYASAKDARDHVAQSVLAAIESGSSSSEIVIKSGELACQRDSYQTTLEDTVPISYALFEFVPTKAKGGKKTKKGKKKGQDNAAEAVDSSITSNVYNKQQIAIALSDSILYPEGGGQPCDAGKLFIESPSSAICIELDVVEVNSIDQICIQTCLVPKDITTQQVVDALEADGTTVRQSLDWDRRFDLMTQHSAQHLISAVALSEPFGMNTHSFSLSTKSDISYVDLLVDTDVDTDAHRDNLKRVEDIVNQNIRLNLPMQPRYLDQDDLQKAKDKGEIRSRLLPSGITGKIRLVEIGVGDAMVDQNTCGGTHVQALAQLQMIKFFKLDRIKSNLFRVYFAAGTRLLSIMEGAYQRQAALTAIMSCTEEEIVDRVTTALNEKREKDREIQRLNEKLCGFQAKEIAVELKSNDMIAAIDVGTADMSYKMALSSAVAERIEDMDGALLLLVGGSDDGDDGSFLLTGDAAMVDKTGQLVAQVLGGRGGGRGGKYQGKGTKIRSCLEEARKVLEEASTTRK
mmetsp:Transcript_2268/g.4810  ORF Transcript_2268/g.4810 Transcript_2268/m.4810 type:complete len:616 (-) Transcript_2268:205-2052(-)